MMSACSAEATVGSATMKMRVAKPDRNCPMIALISSSRSVRGVVVTRTTLEAQETSPARERARSSVTHGSAIADLVVTIAVGVPSSGADATYDVRVANAGPSTATGVTLALTAAADTVFVAPPG